MTLQGPFTESRKIFFDGHIRGGNGTHGLVDFNGKSQNNEHYELKFEGLELDDTGRGQATIVLNRDGVELWKVKLTGPKNGPESLHISYNGTVYNANWKLEQSSGNEQKILLKLSNEHKFLDFVFNKQMQSGNLNLKSNFIVELIEALFRNYSEN